MKERFVWHDKQAFVQLCCRNRWIQKLLPLIGEKKAEEIANELADYLEPFVLAHEGRELVLECEEIGFRSFEGSLSNGPYAEYFTYEMD